MSMPLSLTPYVSMTPSHGFGGAVVASLGTTNAGKSVMERKDDIGSESLASSGIGVVANAFCRNYHTNELKKPEC